MARALLLETFLRGMETEDLHGGSDDTLALKPSLEGWKLRPDAVVRVGNEDLETFLRGMETGDTKPFVAGLGTLKPSLEGWKPASSANNSSSGGSLETFLRGMETLKNQGVNPRRLIP